MDKNQKVVLGFILGIAAGALAGILMAPDSGDETRRKITDKAKGVKDDLSDQITTAINKLSAYVDKVQDELKGVASQAVEKAQENVN
jgi:gas vesicle protein